MRTLWSVSGSGNFLNGMDFQLVLTLDLVGKQPVGITVEGPGTSSTTFDMPVIAGKTSFLKKPLHKPTLLRIFTTAQNK